MLSKNISHLLLFFISSLCLSCLSEPELNHEVDITSISGKFHSSTEAENYAIIGLKSLNKGSRSNENRSYEVGQSYLYISRVSRTAAPDTTLYIVNFKDGGFAFVCARKDIGEKIHLISENGFFDPESTSESKFLADMVSNNIACMEPSVSDQITTVMGDTIEPFEPNPGLATVEVEPGVHCIPRVSTSEFEIAPKLETMWHQKAPYNFYCYNDSGECLVGCAPLAMGQIFAFHRKPESFEGYKYDWDTMLEFPSHFGFSSSVLGIAHLLHSIGVKAGTEYGVTASTTEYKRLYDVLPLFGYNDAIMSKYSTGLAFTSIEKDGPIYMRGFNTINKTGHGWVGDGGRMITTTTTYIRVDNGLVHSVKRNQTYYFHCMMGQKYGEYNGLYLYGNFGMGSAKFNYDITIIYNIK